MNKVKSEFKAYFPDDGEGPEDAIDVSHYEWRKVTDAEDAADEACEYDYGERDGWERGAGNEFTIVIIDKAGAEHRFMAWHEPAVEHRTRRTGGD